MSLNIIGVRQGFFFDKVRIQADTYHECTFGSLLGDRTFFMNQGDAITIRRSKEDMCQIGQHFNHLGHVVNSMNWTKFKWFWRN